MVKAVRNNIERNFSDTQWKRMPRGKYGWVQAVMGMSTTPVPSEIVEKKSLGNVAANIDVPQEIVIPKRNVPEEIISKAVEANDDLAQPALKKVVRKIVRKPKHKK